jgi:hypothetical protein
MSTESGWSNQKKYGEQQYKTIHSFGSDRHGIAASQMYLYDLTAVALAVVAATEDDEGKVLYIEATGHGASVGDVCRVITAATASLEGWEYEICEIVDANIIGVWNTASSIPAAADTVKMCRWVSAKGDQEGSLAVSSGPIQYVHNGVNQTVTVDTVTPANTRPLPVELYGAGTTINLTAGDINVQLSHTGASYDSTRIGDGTTLLAIEAVTGKALVKDSEAITELQDIESDVEAMSAKLPATLGQKTAANSLAVALASDTTLPLPTGAATLAKQDEQITELTAIKTAVELIDNAVNTDGAAAGTAGLMIGGKDGAGDFQQVSVNAAGELSVTFGAAAFATETTLAALNNKVANNYGAATGAVRTASQIGNTAGAADFNAGADSAQTLRVSANIKRAGNELAYNSGAADANTLRVAIATGANGLATESKQDAEAVLIGAVTEVAPATDTASSGLNGRLQRIAQRLTSLISLLPSSLGQKTMANSLAVTFASDQSALSFTQAALAGSYQEDLTVTDGAVETFTAPAGAKWALIQADDANTGNARVKIGAAATTTSGIQIQPGRDIKLDCGGDVSYTMESGGTGKLYVQFGA